jgi:phenylalanine-4-hydroxylase
MTVYTAKFPDETGYIDFNKTEDQTWQTLIDRQDKVVVGRACPAFIDGLKILDMPRNKVPQCKDINKVLMDCTGWCVEPVPAIIPQDQFFTMLANRKFPAASFIRIPEELDYLPEPDIFHELYGHCPLLTHQAYADFLEWYGKMALQTDDHGQAILARLFWYTIEFGLIQRDGHTYVYGGGILSSKEETIYAVESDVPERRPLNILDALRTPYCTTIIQPLYYCIEQLEDLYKIQEVDLLALLKQVDRQGDLEAGFTIC